MNEAHLSWEILVAAADGRDIGGDHLDRCAQCQAEVRELKTLQRRLGVWQALPSPPVGWMEKARAQLHGSGDFLFQVTAAPVSAPARGALRSTDSVGESPGLMRMETDRYVINLAARRIRPGPEMRIQGQVLPIGAHTVPAGGRVLAARPGEPEPCGSALLNELGEFVIESMAALSADVWLELGRTRIGLGRISASDA